MPCNLLIRIYISWTIWPILCEIASEVICLWLIDGKHVIMSMPGCNHIHKAFKIICILISNWCFFTGFTGLVFCWHEYENLKYKLVSKEIAMNPLRAHFKTCFFLFANHFIMYIKYDHVMMMLTVVHYTWLMWYSVTCRHVQSFGILY